MKESFECQSLGCMFKTTIKKQRDWHEKITGHKDYNIRKSET